MSATLIRQLLESTLATISPAIDTAWENSNFVPTSGEPYQAVYLLLADPKNPEIGVKGLYIESGIFQVTLKYPFNNGAANAIARAELIRSIFYQGRTFTGASTTLTVARTPTIAPGIGEGDRWSVPVKIRITANCFS